MSPKTIAYNSSNLPSVEIATPSPQPNIKNSNIEHMWTLLNMWDAMSHSPSHNMHLWKDWYRQYHQPFQTILHPPLPYADPCRHATDSFNIHRLSHLTHAQQTQIGTHQQPCNSYLTNHHAYQNAKGDSYNRMHALLTCIRDRLPQKLAPTIELNTWYGKYKHHPS